MLRTNNPLIEPCSYSCYRNVDSDLSRVID